jgi:hypothetical protein
MLLLKLFFLQNLNYNGKKKSFLFGVSCGFSQVNSLQEFSQTEFLMTEAVYKNIREVHELFIFS